MVRAADLGRTRGRDARLQRTLITPEGVALDVQVASASARAGALLIDLAALLGMYIAFILALVLTVWMFERANLPSVPDSIGGFLVVLFIIGTFLARNAYFLYFELGQRAATWGKRALGIRVAVRDGGRLTAEAVIARNLLRDIELFLPVMFMTSSGIQGSLSEFAAWAGLFWVGSFALFPLLNKDRLRCGDLIAGTWVVQAPKAQLAGLVATGVPENDLIAALPSDRYRFTEAELAVYGEYELQTLEQVLRTANAESMQAVAATICGKIGWTPPTGDERAFLEAYYTQLRARLERGMRFGRRRADKNS